MKITNLIKGCFFLVALTLVPAIATATPKNFLVDDAPCAGRLIQTYFDTTRGDVPVLATPLFGAVFTGNQAVLKGFLYLPNQSNVANSPKNLPLIIFDHGSGKPVNDMCEMATYFTDQGYALFIPHRRGHGLSTGIYWTDFLDQACNRTAQDPFGVCGRVLSNTFLLTYLQDQTFEVAQAISYLSTLTNSSRQPIINSDKVAIMGHSFGGMVTLFNNNILTNHKLAIDIAGASESWDFFDEEDGTDTPDNSNSIRMLKEAVRGANKPIFFLEPKNDVSIRPTVIFSKVAGDHAERYQASIYAPVPNVSSTEDAHTRFVTDQEQIHKWGPAALEFMSRFGVK